MGARRRIASVACALAVLAVPFLGPAAVAQTEATFLPGQWVGDMWFRFKAPGGNVDHVGSGGLELKGTLQADGSTSTTGSVTFAVFVGASTDIAKTARVYEADWPVLGSSSELHVAGDVIVRGVDAAKLDYESAFGTAEIDFVTTGTGVLDVTSASCASISGTFTTGVIGPPGADPRAGVAFTAPFWAIRRDSEELRDHWLDVQAAANELFFDRDPDDHVSTTEVAEFVELLSVLNDLIVGADFCGKGRGTPVPGVVHETVSKFASNLMGIVLGEAGISYSPEELISLYGMCASLGVFSLGHGESVWIPEGTQYWLGYHLDNALLGGDLETVGVIHAGAVQWGWDDLERRSTVTGSTTP